MKRSAFIFALFLGTTLFLASCSSFEIPEEKKSYIGTWTGEGIYLDISEDSKISYEKNLGSGRTSINAPITGFDGDSFSAGALGIETKFEVSQPPMEENGIWTMVVDGRKLTKTMF